MASKQYKKLECLDVNPTGGCAFEIRAETEDEVMRMVTDHGTKMHKMPNIPTVMAAKINGAIKSVTVNV
jgi:predicted small metal-binding protein